MASRRKKYNVYGYKRSAGLKVGEYIGTVEDYNSDYALERARKEKGKYYVITGVYPERQGDNRIWLISMPDDND